MYWVTQSGYSIHPSVHFGSQPSAVNVSWSRLWNDYFGKLLLIIRYTTWIECSIRCNLVGLPNPKDEGEAWVQYKFTDMALHSTQPSSNDVFILCLAWVSMLIMIQSANMSHLTAKLWIRHSVVVDMNLYSQSYSHVTLKLLIQDDISKSLANERICNTTKKD